MKFSICLTRRALWLAGLALAMLSSCQHPFNPAETDAVVNAGKLSSEILSKRNSKSNTGGSALITWSGRRWYVRSSSSYTGPGLNVFSGSAKNVWVDSQGMLHLRISYANGKWQCAEIFSEQSLGYGEYIFYTASQVDKIDRNAVFGMFTWDDKTFTSDGNSEIDIEFSRWGNTANPPLLYSVQPTNGGGYPERNFAPLNFSLSGNYSTHAFKWAPDSVQFKSFYDWGYPSPWPAAQWEFLNSATPRRKMEGGLVSDYIVIPKPGAATRAHLNLWLFDADNNGYGDAPADGKAVEVVVKSFEFRPL